VRTDVPVLTSLVNTPYGPDQRARLGTRRVLPVQAMDALTARLVQRFHANAEHVAQTMSRRLLIARRSIEVIPRGRDPEALGRRDAARRERVRAELGIGDEPVVLALARHEQQKGLDVLLDAIDAPGTPLAASTVLVAGREGAATDALRARRAVLRTSATVRFLGYRSDVADLLAASDVFVLPSRREGFPGVLLEALALETPIVTTDLPGAREALGDDTALIVPIGDSVNLRAAILETLAAPAAANERAAAGRARFDASFTTASIAERMADLYRRVAR
jgi:glycosyltransferase involved in cell wall biosynthesis